MLYRISIFLLMLFFFNAVSPHMALSQCNCKSEFLFLQSYMEKNYPGFKDKIPAYGGLDYKKYTQEYKTKTAKEKNTTYCMVLIKEWLKYFKDNHIQVVRTPSKGNDSALLNERIKTTERIKITPAVIKKIKESKGIEGIYYRDDSVYKVAVIKSPNSWRTYAVVVLETKDKNWQPGMVKFELGEKNDSSEYEGKWFYYYPSIYYYDDYTITTNKIISFSGYGMDGGIWKKEGLKESADEQAKRDKWKQERKNNPKKDTWSFLEFNKLGENCAYMRISSFNGDNALKIDSFVKANDLIISHTPYLIIDLRNNGGGADRSYSALIPYLYTGPIVSVGMSMLATNDNIEAVMKAKTTIESEEIKHSLDNEIKEMQENLGHFTPAGNDTIVKDSVKRYPQKIAILVNGNCASTTEQFLLAAHQSSKVIIMGHTTNGTLDYSNKRPKPFPCIPYTLEYPITRSGRLPQYPIDNIGIKPDVVLTTTDWIKEAMEYLQKTKN